MEKLQDVRLSFFQHCLCKIFETKSPDVILNISRSFETLSDTKIVLNLIGILISQSSRDYSLKDITSRRKFRNIFKNDGDEISE